MPRHLTTFGIACSLYLLPLAGGCTLASDEYGVCVPGMASQRGALSPQDAYAAAVNPPAAVVCYPEGAATASTRERNNDANEAGLAITSNPDNVRVFSAKSGEEMSDFRISACLDLDFCVLDIHQRIRLVATTDWGSSVCGDSDFEIADCSCEDSTCNDEACGEISSRSTDTTADEVYLFVSQNGRDFEYVAAVSPAGGGSRAISLETEQRAYRFVRICRPERDSTYPHMRINHVRVDG